MRVRKGNKGITTVESIVITLLIITLVTSGAVIFYGTQLSSFMADISDDVALILDNMGAGPGPTPTPTYGGTLIVGKTDDCYRGLDPRFTLGAAENRYAHLIYECLVRFKNDSTDVEPALATDWTIAPDGLSITFNLREGVKFHDGAPFNADAVITNFDSKLDENSTYYVTGYISGPRYLGHFIKSWEKIDDYTVKLTYSRKYAPGLGNLAMYPASMISPKALQEEVDKGEKGEYIRKHPVGTGPWKLVDWEFEDHMLMEANEEYWDGRPYLDRILWRTIPDPSVQLMELKAGTIDMTFSLTPDQILGVEGDPNLKVIKKPMVSAGYVALHNEKAPFNNTKVRLAVNYAIDRETIAKYVFLGTSEPLYMYQLPTIEWAYDPTIKEYEYDPEKARELLAEAGYSDGFETTLKIPAAAQYWNVAGLRTGEVIKDQLSKVGIDVTIEVIDVGAVWNLLRAGEYDMLMAGLTALNGDPDDYLNSGSSAFVLTRYRTAELGGWNPEVVEALMAASESFDKAERKSLYKQAAEIMLEDAPLLMYHMPYSVYVMGKYVYNFEQHYITLAWRFHEVWMQK